MSGGPIYDTLQEKVVGIASKYNYTTGNIDRYLAIAIPAGLLSNFLPSLQVDIRVTDEEKKYLEVVINEYTKEFQKNGNNHDLIYHTNFYVENRNAAIIDKAEDWEKTDKEIYNDQSKVKNIKAIVDTFLEDKGSVDKLRFC